MKKVFQSVFFILALIGAVVFGILDLRISFLIVEQVVGSTVAFISLLVAPITFALAPLYALIAWGDWHPLLIIYGGGILIAFLFWASGVIKTD